ncbi:hypothetical protein PG996_003616 [Apiospora saccharicola]|uniref:Uncharacterized protein n=1 Tax=Apiospora saccharicola TaxID=335842 RepID=A0ABR1W1S7_9PEZI
MEHWAHSMFGRRSCYPSPPSGLTANSKAKREPLPFCAGQTISSSPSSLVLVLSWALARVGE